MTIHIVETGDDDASLSVARHIAGLLDEGQTKTALADTAGSKFLEECSALAKEARWDELIKRLSGQLDRVFAQSSEKDAECCVSVIVMLVSRLEKDASLTELARKLAMDIGKQPEVAGEAKLNGLLSLYTNCSTAPARYLVLLQTLEFAKQSKQLATLLAPVVKGKADEWNRVWGLKPSMAVELYVQLAALMKVVGDRATVKEYLRLLTSALALVGDKDAAELAKLKPFAVEAVKAFIRSPDTFQCDFWELPAVQQLARDAAGGPLLALLDVMLRGDLAGFKAAASPAVLESAGVSADAALDKMRFMSLLVLGAKAGGEALPFSAIQAALDISADQVQPWVVRAIGAKLVEAKIDQVSGTVTVSRCHHRSFTSAEWRGLGQQLGGLREALQSASDMLASQAAARGGPASSAARTGVAAQAVH